MIGIADFKRIKILIVDDSALARKILTEEISSDPGIEIVGTAPDPYIARDKIVQLRPDVVLLDIEMPRMGGLTFLRILMKHYPLPVIIMSSLAQGGGEVALKAIEFGALDVVAKPGSSYSVKDMGEQLIEKIKAVSTVKQFKTRLGILRIRFLRPWLIQQRCLKPPIKSSPLEPLRGEPRRSEEILTQLPVEMPPILIVQHMPQYFTKSFAQRLNSLCKLEVKEAEDRELATPGKALIAPGNKHMILKRSGAIYYIEIKDGPLVFHQRPSVEVLFSSVAKYAGQNAIGILLTGMGKDGAKSLLDMRDAGAFTMAQDEKSSVVFGMPKEAIALGAVMKIAPLNSIIQELLGAL